MLFCGSMISSKGVLEIFKGKVKEGIGRALGAFQGSFQRSSKGVSVLTKL